MKNLELTDNEASVLTHELTDITGNDRCSLSSRVQTLKAILAKLERPKPPAFWRFSRGTPYFNDQIKLFATFFNNIAVAFFTSAFVVPLFSNVRLPWAIAGFALFIAVLCLFLAQHLLGKME
jgi:hypothetical protein